jgi:hypothetical protein
MMRKVKVLWLILMGFEARVVSEQVQPGVHLLRERPARVLFPVISWARTWPGSPTTFGKVTSWACASCEIKSAAERRLGNPSINGMTIFVVVTRN